MATINREATVHSSADTLWSKLFEDPNRWPDWLTPVRGLEERASGPVRAGSELSARLGNIGGKIRVTEATRGQRLRWKAGPPMLLAMGTGMKGSLELHATGNGSTHVHLKMKSPLMLGPMLKMMSGLNLKDEMTKTIGRIKELGERSEG
jgi:Polyketide cyclase / dehydrase and lipid transport